MEAHCFAFSNCAEATLATPRAYALARGRALAYSIACPHERGSGNFAHGLYSRGVIARTPMDDSGQEPRPVDWQDIPMAPGSEPRGPLAYLQFSPDVGSARRGDDVRRKPGYEQHVVIHRPPERPA